MNTRVSYLYRDACNYKNFDDVIGEGILSIEQLVPFMKDKTFFIPSKVGLLDLQSDVWTEDDHIWHEIQHLQVTSEMPTIDVTAEQLKENFKRAHINEWYEVSLISGRK
ncbi:MAG: hypothetical protein KAI66_24025 [Lentisphaeria bacterium]|nr:hypothetical protein [Lentisphaeria bacterium]